MTSLTLFMMTHSLETLHSFIRKSSVLEAVEINHNNNYNYNDGSNNKIIKYILALKYLSNLYLLI